MLMRTSTSVAISAALLTVALAATGCGLLETNDDELETLRVEIIQLREDFLEIEAEVSLMARRVASTTTTPAPATTAAPTAVTTTVAPADAADEEVMTPAVPVGLDEDTILTATYQWGPSDPAIILQELLGITADGWYGNGTRGAHLAELEARDLDASGVPSPPTTTTEATADDAAAADATADATADAAADATTTTEATEATTTTTGG
jgi:hypothetical protein